MGLTGDIFAKRGSWQLFRSVGGYDLSAADMGHIDQHGKLWLRLPHVLLCTDGVHVLQCHQPEWLKTPLSFNSGFCCNDRFWAITPENRLVSLRLEDGTVEDHTDRIPSLEGVYGLWVSCYAGILIGLPGILIRYDGCNAKILQVPGARDARVRCAGVSVDGDLWITLQSGLYLLDDDGFRKCPIPDGRENTVWDFLPGPNRTLWLPTREKLLYYENGSFRDVIPSDYQYVNSSSCLCLDRDHNAWFSIHFRGAAVVNTQGIRLFPFEDTPGVRWPRSIVQDPTGAFWHIGVQNGILRYDPRGMSVVLRGYIEAIAPMQDGHYLVAAASRGLLDIDGTEIHQLCEHLPSRIFSLFVDSNHDLYICSGNGLFIYDSREGDLVLHVSKQEKNPLNRAVCSVLRDCNGLLWVNQLDIVWCEGPGGQETYPHASLPMSMKGRLFMFCDEQGVLWLVSGQDQPVLRFNKGRFEVVQEKHTLGDGSKPHDRIFSLTQDQQGRLWAGSRSTRVFRFFSETGTFSQVPVPGLLGCVNHVRVEASGEMWICTTQGLFRHDGSFTYRMTESNLLPSRRAVASYRVDDETVLIATELGVCHYHPRYDVAPEIAIGSLASNQSYDALRGVLACEESETLSIPLSAWNVKPGPLVYRYRLVGWEDDWAETLKEECVFEGVPQGRYRFEVEAFDQDLVFCRERIDLELNVIPNQQAAHIAALEGELEEARAYAENIIRSMRDMVVVLNMEGLIVSVNPAISKVLGYAVADVLGRMPGEVFFFGQHCPVDAAGIARLKQVHHFQAQEVELQAKDGNVLPAILSAFCLHDSGGSLEGFVLTASDISEYKVLQRQMLQSQKMKSLGLLAGGIAHDFNNLLTTMIGNTELVAGDLEAEAPQQEYLGDIIAAGKQAAKLCAELLMYCGKGKPKKKSLALSDIVRQNTGLLKSSISRKITIKYDLADDLPLVWGDEVQIMQVVLNLVMNASDAIGDEAGFISLRTRLENALPEEAVAVFQEGDGRSWVLLEVADTGCGMDTETLAQIFEPFFTTKFTGRGLGLSAIQGIVQSHNGTLLVDSTPGKGTTFKVYLPVSEQEQLSEPETDAPRQPAAPGVALVVDDDGYVRKTLKHTLVHQGFEVVEAVDGADALDKLRAQLDRIDIVFLDITMPVMDGYEAYGEIRALSADLPILVMSGLSEEEIEARLPADDRLRLLPKPFTRKQLSEMLVEMDGSAG